jgi:hypothetical protein
MELAHKSNINTLLYLCHSFLCLDVIKQIFKFEIQGNFFFIDTLYDVLTHILTTNANKKPHKSMIQENHCVTTPLILFSVEHLNVFIASTVTKCLIYLLRSQHVPASVSSSSKRSKLRESVGEGRHETGITTLSTKQP